MRLDCVRRRVSCAVLTIIGCGALLAWVPPVAADVEFNGHGKLRLIAATVPDNSVLRALAGAESVDAEGDLRLNLTARREGFTFDANYQLIGLKGDRVEYTRQLPGNTPLFVQRLPTDERRALDLTHVMHDEGDSAWLQRLDRLWLGYASEKSVVRVGRQAISWGNGLFYAPMDLVNPFDPSTVDTEYKPGDDMAYLQYLRDNGDDVQAAVVVRRDIDSGEVEADAGTSAVKYHGFAGETEYEFLLADHYADTVLGIGAVQGIGGAVWRADVVWTDAAGGDYFQLVSNLSYSWVLGGKNMNGSVEYFFSGVGQSGGRYDPDSLADNPQLVERLRRGDLYTLGRHYIAGNVSIEMSPLWTLSPTLLANLGDPSALLQIITQYSLSDEMLLLGSLNLPLGSDGSEFGGIETGTDGAFFSTGAGVFAQFAWYF